MSYKFGREEGQYEKFQRERFQKAPPPQPEEKTMFNIYFSQNNEGKSKIKMECFETRESIDSAIRFIVSLWPEENPVQQIAMITNALTNTVVASVMRGPNGECIVTVPDLPNPTIHVYSVMYDNVTCPACYGKKKRTADPCAVCYDKGTKLVCRAICKRTPIELPPQVTVHDGVYEDDTQ